MGVVSQSGHLPSTILVTDKSYRNSVDAMNDIQSCGGCWSEGTGQDCTLLLDAKDRHASVACVKGQCKGQSPLLSLLDMCLSL
jgi:hypothetical protein